jgi:hypothetical protein
LLFYSIYTIIIGGDRAGVPFSEGSSGPLGLIAISYFIAGIHLQKMNIRTSSPFLISSIALLLFGFSKSFILSALALFIINFKIFKIFSTRFIIYAAIVSSVAVYFMWHQIYFYLNLDIPIIELTTLVDRIEGHWFNDWELFWTGTNYIIGLGVQNITIAFDSAYFFILYNTGILGCIIYIFWSAKKTLEDDLFRTIIVTIIFSGLFLETIFISYRGLEPFIFLISLTYSISKRLKNITRASI